MKLRAVLIATIDAMTGEINVAESARLEDRTVLLSVTKSDGLIYGHFAEPDLDSTRNLLEQFDSLWTWHIKIAGDEIDSISYYMGTVSNHPNDLHIFASFDDDKTIIEPPPQPPTEG